MSISSSISSKTPTDVSGDRPGLLDLSVIIVNCNVREFLEQALRSVERASNGLNVEVFVVDNNSVDGSVDMMRTHFPDVHLIANVENYGFGKANNQAIAQARGRYLLILNPDTIVQEDTFSTLVAFMEAHPEAGAVGCQILNPDGTFALESRRSFPTPPVAFFRMTGLSRLFPKNRLFGRYNLTYLPIDEVAEIDALSGSCMLVRRAALYYSHEEFEALAAPDVAFETTIQHPQPAPSEAEESQIQTWNGAGLLDESFFMYGEDLDWCYRIQQAGWKIFYTPDTQIIHYKGESTKKSELRYVRLFYGAMLRFAEKHLEDRYPRVFLWMMRLGVVARASLTVLGNTVRRLAFPLLDLVLVLALVIGLGELRSAQTGVPFLPLFYWLVAPGYALITMTAIAALGGYRGRRRRRIGPVWLGTGIALMIIATLSFFFKEIAFSRAVVLAGFPAGAMVLSVVRLLRRIQRRGTRQALFVGHAGEALRLQHMLTVQRQAPFQLIGYITPDAGPELEVAPDLPCLGTLHHLRDLVRLRRIEDVVFAAASLSNQVIFTLMQRLHGLPTQTRILAEGREHVIGKASIDDLSTPALIEAEDALGTPRSQATRRVFEGAMALLAMGAHPFIRLMAWFKGERSFWDYLAQRTQQWRAVLAGRQALVGYRVDDPFTPPPEWKLQPGVFTVTDTLGRRLMMTPEEAEQAYWFYVRNQSAFLDWIIVMRAMRMMR